MSGATGTVLDRILAETREAVARRRAELPIDELAPAAGAGGRRFRDALAAPGIGVIAEFKRCSPSAGSLGDAPDLEQVLSAYGSGGAVAASILTEGPNFGGWRALSATCRCCARTSSSTPTSCTRRSPPAPTRCC
jgi:indole-3-glycerol phosphate synthase